MLVVGKDKAYAHWMRSPDGKTVFEVSTEGLELMFGIGKSFTSNKGTGKEDSLIKLGEFWDLYNMGSVTADMIDFGAITRKNEREQLLIFDPINTPIQEQSFERRMPKLMRLLIRQLEDLDFGDTIPPMLLDILGSAPIPDNSPLRAALCHDENFVLATEEETQAITEEYYG